LKFASALDLLGIEPRREPTLLEREKDQIEDLIIARIAARRAKNFAESDRLRDELVAMGIQLKDGKDADGNPTTDWEVKR
jgi:cysteinyl-tRNA synthetase